MRLKCRVEEPSTAPTACGTATAGTAMAYLITSSARLELVSHPWPQSHTLQQIAAAWLETHCLARK
jgi:hypothetical protein